MGGATPKPLVRLGSDALLQRTLRAYLDSGLDEILVVVGYAGDSVRAAVDDARVRVVENPSWQKGLGGSIARAVEALSKDTDRILIGLADMPWVSREVIVELLEADGSIVAPVFDAQRGHPVRFDRIWFDDLRQLDGDRGAGGLLSRHLDRVTLLPVEEPGVLRDLDEPSDLPADLPGVVLRGGGDLATGVAHCLYRAGFPVLILELAQPRMLRSTVSFSQAVYSERWTVEGVTARRFLRAPADWRSLLPVVVDPSGEQLRRCRPSVLVDARLLKRPDDLRLEQADFVVALGPGVEAGKHCHAVIETNRGSNLGKVIREGAAEPDTGIPGVLGGESFRRVIRSPGKGRFRRRLELGAVVKRGEQLGWVEDLPVFSQLDGLLRGLVHSGLEVDQGEKVADVDPRADTDLHAISDKARLVGNGVLRAIQTHLARKNIPVIFKIENIDQGELEQT